MIPTISYCTKVERLGVTLVCLTYYLHPPASSLHLSSQPPSLSCMHVVCLFQLSLSIPFLLQRPPTPELVNVEGKVCSEEDCIGTATWWAGMGKGLGIGGEAELGRAGMRGGNSEWGSSETRNGNKK